jgi:AcrR family transcriptional regulator
MPGVDGENEAKQRIRTALVDVVGANEYSKTSLEEILGQAGIDREEFDRLYPNFEECLVENWIGIMRDEFWPRSEAAFERGGDDWRESLRYQAWDLLRFVEDDIPRARFLIELSLAEEAVQANRDVAMSRIVDYVHLGRFESGAGPEVPRATAEALVGAVWNGLAQNIQPPVDYEALRGGSPQILYLTMMAYLGQDAAQEELRRGPKDLERYERGEL